MQIPVEIRKARAEDAASIGNLILGVVHYFALGTSDEIPAWFLESVSPAAIAGYIEDRSFNYLVAQQKEKLVGVVALRDLKHVYHLFVDPEVHRQGVAARLWERARVDAIRAGNREGFFVRSSKYAVPVYERFGFRVTGPASQKDGIVFVPMRLGLSD